MLTNTNQHTSNLHTSTIHSDKTCGVSFGYLRCVVRKCINMDLELPTRIEWNEVDGWGKEQNYLPLDRKGRNSRKHRRIPYFSSKVHFLDKTIRQLPYNNPKTLKTQEYQNCHQIMKTCPEMKTHATTFRHYFPYKSISFKNYYLMYTEHWILEWGTRMIGKRTEGTDER